MYSFFCSACCRQVDAFELGVLPDQAVQVPFQHPHIRCRDVNDDLPFRLLCRFVISDRSYVTIAFMQ